MPSKSESISMVAWVEEDKVLRREKEASDLTKCVRGASSRFDSGKEEEEEEDKVTVKKQSNGDIFVQVQPSSSAFPPAPPLPSSDWALNSPNQGGGSIDEDAWSPTAMRRISLGDKSMKTTNR